MSDDKPNYGALARANAAYAPPEYSDPDIHAIRAVASGEASPEQQRRALDWIIQQAASTYDLGFIPGPDGDRNTSFMLGRQFVGMQIVKLCNMPVIRRRVEDGRRTDESGTEQGSNPE